jgi:hypothetical protein
MNTTLIFDTLLDAEVYCSRYASAPDRTVSIPRQDDDGKWLVSVRLWSLD